MGVSELYLVTHNPIRRQAPNCIIGCGPKPKEIEMGTTLFTKSDEVGPLIFFHFPILSDNISLENVTQLHNPMLWKSQASGARWFHSRGVIKRVGKKESVHV